MDYQSEDYESEDYESEDHDVDYEFLSSLYLMCSIVNSLVFVLGALGNGVVIWVTGFKMKKTINTVWFLNLAVADFVYIAFLPLLVIFHAMDFHWPFGKFMCKISLSVDSLAMFACVYVLVVISVDRCVSVVWPVWVQNHRSVRNASYASLGVWVLALVLSSPKFILLDTGPNPYNENYTECLTTFSNSSDDYEAPAMVRPKNSLEGAMYITSFYLGYVVPFTIIISCYAVILHQLWKNRSLASHLGGRHFQITLVVITSYFFCFTPLHLQYILYPAPPKHSERLPQIWINISDCLQTICHCLNPLFYVIMGQDFKNKARKPILKVLESAFTEEEPRSNPSTNLSLSDAK